MPSLVEDVLQLHTALQVRSGRRLKDHEFAAYFGATSPGTVGAWLNGKTVPLQKRQVFKIKQLVDAVVTGAAELPAGVLYTRDGWVTNKVIMERWHNAAWVIESARRDADKIRAREEWHANRMEFQRAAAAHAREGKTSTATRLDQMEATLAQLSTAVNELCREWRGTRGEG